tara:strand:- start:32178 stop:32663 length:486 start_codon:yes stop_codon:yes gene_type:complete
MAVTTQKSTEYTNQTATPPEFVQPTEMAGRVRIMYFTHDQSGAGDATSSVALGKIPGGRVRLLLSMSKAYVNWTTSSATLDLGWDAYEAVDGTTTAADPDGLVDGLNVDTAGYFDFGEDTTATGGTYVFESKDGVVIRATSQDVALAAGSDLVGYIAYVVD